MLYRPEPIDLSLQPLEALLARLKALYYRMDLVYQEVAARYGFHCTGCEDSCCRTLFFHHTHLEYYYLMRGLAEAGEQGRHEFNRRAAFSDGSESPLMCPLNEDGLCGLYAHRPMICRLHGLAHHFVRPDGKIVRGPGCGLFTEQCGHQAYVAFDRTPFYRELAELESAFRTAFHIAPQQRLKLTIAQMLEPISKRPLLPDLGVRFKF